MCCALYVELAVCTCVVVSLCVCVVCVCVVCVCVVCERCRQLCLLQADYKAMNGLHW